NPSTDRANPLAGGPRRTGGDSQPDHRGLAGLLRDCELYEDAGPSRSVRLASAVGVLEEATGSTRSAVPGGVCGVGAAERPGLLLSHATTWFSLARRRVNVVGKPYEG